MTKDGLLLVAHGGRGDDGTATKRLGRALSTYFSEVQVSFLHGRPSPAEALVAMRAPLVHVVPLLAAQGWAGREILRECLPGGERHRLLLHPPIGEHPGLAAMVEQIVGLAMARMGLDKRQTAVVLLGHGSGRNPAAGSVVGRLAGKLADLDCAAEIHALFLSQPPYAKDWAAAVGMPDVIAVPCFFSVASHVLIDLRALMEGDEIPGRRLWMTPPLAAQWQRLAPLVLDLVATGSAECLQEHR